MNRFFRTGWRFLGKTWDFVTTAVTGASIMIVLAFCAIAALIGVANLTDGVWHWPGWLTIISDLGVMIFVVVFLSWGLVGFARIIAADL